jgi:hypothetical protein
MRLLDRLVWTHLLEHPCRTDLERCPARAHQCAACPHRHRGVWATLCRDLGTIPSLLRHLRRRRDLRPLRERFVRESLWGFLIFLGLMCLVAAYLGWSLAHGLAR